MPRGTRSENQYIGKYYECCVTAVLNKSEIDYKENYELSESIKEEIYNNAKITAEHIGPHIATYVGNLTSSATGDLVLDTGETVELKYVSNGNGTYHNTSLYYFERFGFNPKEYMIRFGLYDVLEKYFGEEYIISRKNKSPVSQSASSSIRHTYEDIYKEQICPIDIAWRKAFTEDVYNYFKNNPEQAMMFATDMINKVTATATSKTKPDRLIVFNYERKELHELNLNDYSKDFLTLEQDGAELSFIINGIRIAISWQNGRGLNNPTIRAYLV